VQKVLQNLLELQNIDLRLNEVRARLARFPKKLTDIEARMAGAKADVDASKAAQLTALKERKKYELDVEQWKERVRKYKDQGSQVKTNEAYRALQHEIQLAEAEIAKAEDRLLEQMVAGEEYDRRIKAADKSLKEVEAVTRIERAKIESDKTTSEKELVDWNAVREGALAQIPENILDNYTRIAKKHNGIGLAEIRDERCSACGMMIRPHVMQEMRRSGNEELFHCETCTRILYFIEQPASAETAAASAAASANREIQ
jgi:predicted  nucleic acid-binding Zn-ribbon protein